MKPGSSEWVIFGEAVYNLSPGLPPDIPPGAIYDATNGTISNGDMVRMGP